MNRITLAILTTALSLTGAAPMTAQDPVPPTPPAPAPRATPRPAPAPRVREPRVPTMPDSPDFTPMAPMAPMGAIGPIGPIGPLSFDVDMDQVRASMRAAQDAMRNIDMDQVREQARMANEASREAMRIDQQDIREQTRMAERLADRAGAFQYTPVAGYASFGRDFSEAKAPEAWLQGDPADSLYRVARDALNRGEYGRAAQLFAELPQKYPKSGYTTTAAPYFEALARYKIGTTEELKTAAKILEPLAAKASTNGSSNVSYDGQKRWSGETDIPALYTRINGTLAQRGDHDAELKVEQAATQRGAPSCDSDDMQVRAEALNALSQMDPAGSLKILRDVVSRKDECTVPLRRNAVFMLGRRNDAESAALIATVAKSDPDVTVRGDAITFLAKQQGDAGVTALEDILRTDQDERVQRDAVRALMSSDNAKARASLRAIIERKDASVNMRVEAVNSFYSDRATPDDAGYLRGVYPKLDNDRVKDAVIGAIARIGGTENEHWLLAIAGNPNETSQLRNSAIARLYRAQTLSIADLSKLYDSADSYNLRVQIINVLAGRKEPEATDKLADIVKNSTDANIRRQAVYAIQRKNDPRSAQILTDIIQGPGPKKP